MTPPPVLHSNAFVPPSPLSRFFTLNRCILFPSISLIAYAHAAVQSRALCPSSTILQVSPPTFDPCIGDIASALYAKVLQRFVCVMCVLRSLSLPHKILSFFN